MRKILGNKVLFVHDGPLFLHENRYFGISYSNAIVNRYKFFGENVSFLMRSKRLSAIIKDYNEINCAGFNYINIPDFKSINTFYKRGEVKRIIKKEVKDHEVIIIRLPSASGTIAFNYAKHFKKPVLIEFVACVFDALWNYNWLGKLLAHYKYHRCRNLMKQAAHTIYVTTSFLQKRYPSSGKSISCSDVVIGDIDLKVLDKRLDKIYSYSNRIFVLGTVAALDVPYKGQPDVIKAVAKLKREGLLFHYRLVGQGNTMGLRKLINDLDVNELVEVIGPLKHDEVFRFLDEIDIYIQPSKVEGLPRAVVEAMSRACPVMGSNVGGIPELLAPSMLFKPGDINNISKKLKGVTKMLLAEQAQANFDRAKNFESKLLNKKRFDFYAQFLIDYNLSVYH